MPYREIAFRQRTMMDWAIDKLEEAGVGPTKSVRMFSRMADTDFADKHWWSNPEYEVAAVVKARVLLAVQRHAKEFLAGGAK